MAFARVIFANVVLVVASAGCAQPRIGRGAVDLVSLKQRSLECLKAAVTYEYNPAVRVEAVEALESCAGEHGLPWIRTALSDGHPAVRFAACAAVGRLGDGVSERTLRERVSDEDESVQVAALFALHRLGHTELTGKMPTYLLHAKEVTVRRNAALVLGLLGEPGAIKVLARAMRDGDAGVRHHVLEAMAKLGNREARQELTFMTNAGVGSEEVFAIGALAGTGDVTYLDTFRYKLSAAAHLETRLAAAWGLGRLGSDEGFRAALHALRIDKPLRKDPGDPPADQILRVKQLAAAALGAIGRVDALPALSSIMDTAADPRVQVSAAAAILKILAADEARALPFATTGRPPGS